MASSLRVNQTVGKARVCVTGATFQSVTLSVTLDTEVETRGLKITRDVFLNFDSFII